MKKSDKIKLILEDCYFKKGEIIYMGASFIVLKAPNHKNKWLKLLSKITLGLYKTRNYYLITPNGV